MLCFGSAFVWGMHIYFLKLVESVSSYFNTHCSRLRFDGKVHHPRRKSAPCESSLKVYLNWNKVVCCIYSAGFPLVDHLYSSVWQTL